MPRNYSDRPRGRDFSTDSQQTAQLQTVARPVDTYVAPEKNSLFGLVDALSTLQPTLKQYRDDQIKEDTDEGRMLALRGGELDGSESDAKVRGYRQLKYDEKGRLAHAALRDQLESIKDDPDFLAQWSHSPTEGIITMIKKRIAEDTMGEADPTMVESYARQVMPLMEQMPIEFIKHQRKKVEEETDNLLNNRTLDMVSNIMEPQALRDAVSNDWPTWQAMGKSRKDYTTSVVKSLIAKATELKDPELLNVADLPGADGHVMTKDPEVLKLISSARATVTELQHKEIEKLMEPVWRDQKVAWNTTLETNPWDSSLDTEELAKHAGKYGALRGENALPAMVKSVLNARQAWDKAQASNTYIMPDMEQWPLWSEDPDFKKGYKQKTMDRLDGIQWDDSASVLAAMDDLKLWYEKSTVPPPALEGLFNGFRTLNVDPNTGEVPPSLMLAYQAYKYFKGSGNAGLLNGLMDDEERAIAHRLDTLMGDTSVSPLSMGEAIGKYNAERAPGKVADTKDLLNDDQLTKKIKEEVKSELKGGWFSDGLNERGLREANRIVRERVIDLMSNSQYNRDDAIELAIMEAKGKIVPDGHGSYVVIPKGYPKDSVLEATTKYLELYKKQNGGEYHLELNEDGNSYSLKDLTRHGLTISDSIPLRDVLGTVRPLTYGSVENKQKMLVLASDFKRGLREDSKESLDKLVDANRNELELLMQGDSFSFMEKAKLKAFLVAKDAIQGNETRESIKKIMNKNRSFVAPKITPFDGKSPLSSSMPPQRVKGTPPNATELAAYYYDKSPLAAMIMDAEGIRLNPYKDSKGLAIGFGFNFNGRSEKENLNLMRKAGIAEADARLILKGQKIPGREYAITTEQAINLLEHSMEKATKQAKEVYGFGWNSLPREAQVVMIDIAYNTGNVAEHRKTIELLRKEDYAGAAKELSLTYVDEDGKRRDNTRRVQIWREMMSGQYGNILKKKASQTKRK